MKEECSASARVEKGEREENSTNFEDHLPLLSKVCFDDLLRCSTMEILDPDTL